MSNFFWGGALLEIGETLFSLIRASYSNVQLKKKKIEKLLNSKIICLTIGINNSESEKGEKREMKKIMIDNRNAKIIVFALVAVLLLIGTVGLASASAAVMSTTRGGGLIAYYPFNGNANDASGNGIDGTVYGATWVDNGGCGKALSFDGNEDSVQIPHTVINNLLDITFSAWINTSEYDAGILTGANSGDADEFLIYITKGLGVLKPHVKNDYLSSERIINDGSWHYISVVREGSSGIVKIFIDGQLDNTKGAPQN